MFALPTTEVLRCGKDVLLYLEVNAESKSSWTCARSAAKKLLADCEVLDKAMYAHVLAVSKKARSVEKYWRIEIDYANTQIFLRLRKSGGSERGFKDAFISGGEIGIDVFLPLMEETDETVIEKLSYTCVGRGIREYAASKSFARFEACKDDEQLEIFKKDRYDLFGVAPVAGYYVAKKSELKAVKMITTLLKIGAEKALIKERLREFYV